MLYRNLVQFDPIESVIQLRSADEKEAAAHLVQTYVISDRMADQLAHVVIPQLRIDHPQDNKGILVVGNYGTGKSHLMSVLSALAEYGDLVPLVRNAEVRDAASHIGGRFLVVRAEIGGVTRPLREIVLGELEEFFTRVGTPYKFPAASQVSNNKDALIEAMGRFNARYPDKGLLFILDELLDFLRTREERELLLDLGFLRELGEVTGITSFRFIAGVQETLFDNPRFSFFAESLRRVRDRFEQVRIAREDIAFVVAERLLKKSDEQLARITTHLRPFTVLYPQMADQLSEYVRLFPVHPAYISTFERVYVAEKREVLQTLSRAISSMLDLDVPQDQPGLISYDQYWSVLRANPALRTLPGVAEVVQKSDILLSRIESAYGRPPLKSMALRIIHALSVQRLTSDIDTPIGVTAEELRDQLCLWVRMPEPTADFLLGQVQVALREIQRTVSGQYISFNSDNGQYYLDLKKDIDFDANIEERGRVLDLRDLNKYFFNALQGLLNLSATTYVTNFRIWPYELPWDAKKVTRPGYLFLSSPQERSTAQPPRDFYLYFLPPFDHPTTKASPVADEVIFALEGAGNDFEELVRRYAGAQALIGESPNNRQVYSDKAEQYLRALGAWLRDHLRTHLRVIHSGATQTVGQVLAQSRNSASADPDELLRVIASHLLEPHFRDSYPEYPAFTRLRDPITEKARENAARDAVQFLARGARTQLALGVLHGLGLLNDEDKVRTDNSPYARYFLDELEKRPANQVVNRGDILTQVAGGPIPVFKDPHFHLEPEWVVVVLLALVYEGRITLNLGRETLDANSIDRAALHGIETLLDFRFYRRPQAMPVYEWKQIFEALGLPVGLVQDEGARDDAIVRLQERVSAEVSQIAETLSRAQSNFVVWGTPLLTDNLTYAVLQGGMVEVVHETETLTSPEMLPHLRRAKDFLEKLQTFNTPGKMRNLTLTGNDLKKALESRLIAQRVAETFRALSSLQELTSYLAQAQTLLPQGHPWLAAAEPVQRELLETVRRDLKAGQPFDASAWRARLNTLRQSYISAYAALHQQYTLGPEDDDRRTRLQQDDRHERMRALAAVDVLDDQMLKQWEHALKALPACREFHAQLLEASAQCPRCHFHPAQSASGPSAASRLLQLDEQLTLTLQQWDAALRANLESAAARASRQSMTAAERGVIDRYLASRNPDAPLPDGLVEAVNQALRGLRMVRLRADEVLAALTAGGFPCTEDDLRERFDALLSARMQGYDTHNTRLAIEPGSD